MERADVARWLVEYVEAWKTYDRDRIVGLFADAASYRYQPSDEPTIGSQAIADSWFEDDRKDPPGTYDAAYEAIAADGDTAVATGSSTYTRPDGTIGDIYDNCFVLRFDEDGRCREFTEFFMKRPADADA